MKGLEFVHMSGGEKQKVVWCILLFGRKKKQRDVYRIDVYKIYANCICHLNDVLQLCSMLWFLATKQPVVHNQSAWSTGRWVRWNNWFCLESFLYVLAKMCMYNNQSVLGWATYGNNQRCWLPMIFYVFSQSLKSDFSKASFSSNK